MAYPSIEQYQIALQYPKTAFTDPELAAGRIRPSGMGTPIVVSGGFALTYALETNRTKYAVRCFHKEAKGIERRYAGISSKLASLASPYFVRFDFQPTGVKANQSVYPVVKMAWAEGKTLGDFVESNFHDSIQLTNLIASLGKLAAYLEEQNIAHGDIQEGNLMVADSGRQLQLIDYDGMFVPEIASLGGAELGHRDYQHPKRDSSHFSARLDRFSFIVLNLSLRALCARPSIWDSSQSGAGVIICRANDFANPGGSRILAELAKIPGLERDVQNFATICTAQFVQIPSLDDFISRRNIPQRMSESELSIAASTGSGYISPYTVLDAANFSAFQENIGSMIELVGKIVHVSPDYLEYAFLNFGDWRGKSVTIALWSDALARSKERPTKAWVGRWVTVRGLVQAFRKGAYDHMTIAAATLAQVTVLTEKEAKYRLTPYQKPDLIPARTNNSTLQKLAVESSKPVVEKAPPRTSAAPRSLSANQLALERMRQQTPPPPSRGKVASPVYSGGPSHQNPPTPAKARATVIPRPPVVPVPPSPSMQPRHEALTQKRSGGIIAWLSNLFK
ncbi:serine/threonine protein kinase [Janthinobacterium sp. PAMC25594]|uniref:serine/threonine protein kinase n=1 Tax=Janthinobacterium sp. PAMC25594 TaxID=2861284 RepID=UPI001C62D9D7|nr:serine/threonine protein kinase [Janthinobacterium sp. PAMC25594]QYG08707.1 serine/threonine protein kinase [Janthinobacterium sp. PAMC25594]